MTSSAPPAVTAAATFRCAVGARARGDAMAATAPPARRFLLLEMPGPWGPESLPAGGLGPGVAARLRERAAAVGARPLLIRRPGRSPSGDGVPRRRAVVALAGGHDAGDDGGPGGAAIRWGTWRTEDDLLRTDLAEAFRTLGPADRPATRPADGGPDGDPDGDAAGRPVALVCTQGRHDLCCAVEGRPVAAAAAADPRVDVWECSHLGGDRFAANLLWLPDGLLFGGLDAASTPAVLDAALSGRVVLEHFRGRCGDPAVVQAAGWQLMRALGERRPDRVVVESAGAGPGPKTPDGHRSTVVARVGERRYRLELEWSRTPPERLTCRAPRSARVHAHRLVAGPDPV